MAGGRPTKLTAELQEEMVSIIRGGNYVETACAFVGITKETFYQWLRRAAKERERLSKNPRFRMKESEAIYVEFSDAIKKAQSQAEIRDVLIIGKAAEHTWQAAAWRLERKFPAKWGRGRREDDELDQGGPIINIIELERDIPDEDENDQPE